MLQLGNGGLTEEEQRSHYTLWSLMNSPLLLGTDITHLPPYLLTMLLNKEIADLNQDPLGWPGRLANNLTSTAGEVWRKKMADGSIVAVLFNKQHLSQPPREMVLDFASVGVPQHTEESKASQVTVRDLWKKQSVGSNASDGSWTSVVPSHGVAVLRLSGFASTLPLKTDDERSGRAFYALHVADLSAPGWPSHFQHYDLFIASLGFSEKDIKKVKEDVPNARVLAYTDWSWAYVDAGCSHADGPKHSHFNFTSYFKQSWAITDLNTGEPVCPFGPVVPTAPKPVWGVAATVLMKESADALARWHSEVTLAGGYDGLYIDNWHASFSASWGKSLLALTNGSFDCNGDGKPDTLTTLQAQYSAWKPYYSMQLRRVLGDKLLLANTGNVAEADASLDGQTIEFEWCATSRGGVRACEAALDAQHAVSLAQGNGREAISVMWLTEANNVAAVVQCRELLQLQSTRQWLLGGTDRSDKSWPANASCGVPGGRVIKADDEAVVRLSLARHTRVNRHARAPGYAAWGPSDGPCPCSNDSLCDAITRTGPEKVFVFHDGYDGDEQEWQLYDWTAITTVCVFGRLSPALYCHAHSLGVRVVFGTNFPPASQWGNVTATQTFIDGRVGNLLACRNASLLHEYGCCPDGWNLDVSDFRFRPSVPSPFR